MRGQIRDAANIEQLAESLDALSAETLRADVDRLSKTELMRMWVLAEKAPALDLDHFATQVAKPVHHVGRNSLLVPSRWRRFEKRFARMDADADTLVGYNEGVARSWLGPGYFVLRQSDSDAHKSRGAVFVDYHSVPEGAVPGGWPPVITNEKGLQKFVYAGTRDFMRKVSERVSIGMPFKGDKMLPFPFALVRL